MTNIKNLPIEFDRDMISKLMDNEGTDRVVAYLMLEVNTTIRNTNKVRTETAKTLTDGMSIDSFFFDRLIEMQAAESVWLGTVWNAIEFSRKSDSLTYELMLEGLAAEVEYVIYSTSYANSTSNSDVELKRRVHIEWVKLARVLKGKSAF